MWGELELKRENPKDNMINFIAIYRTISVVLTMLIYIVHGISENYDVPLMIFLSVCVIILAFLLQYIYRLNYENEMRLGILLTIEILGISVIMVITGGLKSPFIWFFLNPLLIISCYMANPKKSIYLVSNFILLWAIGYYVERDLNLGEYFLLNLNILLSYTLILILIDIIFKYNRQLMTNQKQLTAAYEDLEGYNARIKGMTNDILYMYEAVQASSSRGDRAQIAGIMLDFADRIIPRGRAFFVEERCRDIGCVITSREIHSDIKGIIVENVKSTSLDVLNDEIMVYRVSDNLMAIAMAIEDIRGYGTVGIVVDSREYERNRDEYRANLRLISQLGSTFFEKIELEFIGNELAIAQEQDRIADDIHDSVVQRLFASSCFGYDTIKKWDEMTDEAKRDQMVLITETIQSSLKDLRSTIYNLSSKRQEIEFFTESIANYLEDMARLSGVNIELNMSGEPNHLSLNARKAIYRIITECTGNAVKHAESKNIWVNINITEKDTVISVHDDGIGMDLERVEREKDGLGLYNIKSLAKLFSGSVNIDTKKGRGTTFHILFSTPDLLKV